MSSEFTPSTKFTKITAACRLDVREGCLELRELALDLGLQYWANAQYLNDVFLFITHVLRAQENSLGDVVSTDTLHNEVDKSLVH